MNIPAQLRAGLSWSWEDTLPEYAAPTWELTYYFTNADGAFSVVAAGVGTVHTIAEASADTDDHEPGRYEWVAVVDDGTDSHQVGTGYVQILPELGSARDVRSWARRALDSLEAQIETDTPYDKVSVAFGGRQITFRSPAEMIEFREYLKGQAAIQEAVGSNGLGRDIRVRFVR